MSLLDINQIIEALREELPQVEVDLNDPNNESQGSIIKYIRKNYPELEIRLPNSTTEISRETTYR